VRAALSGIDRLAVTVRAQNPGSLVETVEIKEGGSIASWEFRTEAHDIGYSVLFVPAATPDKPIKVS